MNCPIVSTPEDQVPCNNQCAWFDWDNSRCSVISIAQSLEALKYKLAPGY